MSAEGEDSAAGRMGRFGRKFEDMGGFGFDVEMDVLEGSASNPR